MDTATPGNDPGVINVSVRLTADEHGELRRRADEEVLPITQHLRRLIRADVLANPDPAGDGPRRAVASSPDGPVR